MWTNKFIRILICFCLFIPGIPVFPQIGGNQIFKFLELAPSARITGLGGSLVNVKDHDVASAYLNPALLNESMAQQISFQHQVHVADIQSGFAAWGKTWSESNFTGYIAAQYIFYGQFDQTDEFGNQTGVFSGKEAAITIGLGYPLYDKLSIGANLKVISSSLENYQAWGVAMDAGAFYLDSASNFSVSLVFRNAGAQIKSYTGAQKEDLPFQIIAGISKRLRYLPFRFSIIYHHLNQWNLLYNDPSTEESGFLFGITPNENNPGGFDNFFRHLIFGGELFVGSNDILSFRVAYNHQRKQELALNNVRSLTGFSIGFGIHLKILDFNYALNKIHIGGTSHHIGFATSLQRFTGTKI